MDYSGNVGQILSINPKNPLKNDKTKQFLVAQSFWIRLFYVRELFVWKECVVADQRHFFDRRI